MTNQTSFDATKVWATKSRSRSTGPALAFCIVYVTCAQAQAQARSVPLGPTSEKPVKIKVANLRRPKTTTASHKIPPATPRPADVQSVPVLPIVTAPPPLPTAESIARHFTDPADRSSLSWAGIVAYGVLDTGVSYQTHGAPLSDTYSQGLDYSIGKPNSHTILSVAPGGLSRSNAGLKGDIPVIAGWSAIFRLETQFLPTSLRTMDGPATLVKNNGLYPGSGLESSNNDSAKAGQIFTYIYGGVASATFGQLTFGRQASLGQDQTLGFDPMPGGPYAFSALGYSSTLNSGFGITEDSILDESLKYRVEAGPIHAGAAFKPGSQRQNANGAAYEGEIGFNYAGFSFDGSVHRATSAISAASLSCAEDAAVNKTAVAACPSGLQAADKAAFLTGMKGGNIGNGLVDATVSDNLAFVLSARYDRGPFSFFGGYENIKYSNPANPLPNGSGLYTDGGYGIYALNQNAYVTGKVLQILWTGARYAVQPNVDLAVAYYHQIQNSYITDSTTSTSLTGLCYNSSLHSNCSGTADSASLLIVYHWTTKLDVYGGAMLSIVNGGMASGYAAAGIAADGKTTISNSAGMIDPTVGLRYQF